MTADERVPVVRRQHEERGREVGSLDQAAQLPVEAADGGHVLARARSLMVPRVVDVEDVDEVDGARPNLLEEVRLTRREEGLVETSREELLPPRQLAHDPDAPAAVARVLPDGAHGGRNPNVVAADPGPVLQARRPTR